MLEPKVKVRRKNFSAKHWKITKNKKFVAKADSLTVGELLDMWAEEELKTGTLSNGTVEKLSWCNPLYQKNTRLQTAN